MGSIVLDCSVVIAFVRKGDPHHVDVVAELRAARLRAETVLAESLVAAHRAGGAAADGMRRDLVGLFGPVRPADESVAVATAALRAEFRSLRLPDALVIATGTVDDAVVLTCDQRLTRFDPRVQAVGG